MQEDIQLINNLRNYDHVATQGDECDYVDPLCSHDDSCHVLILHIKVAETPGNIGNLSQNNAPAHQDLSESYT